MLGRHSKSWHPSRRIGSWISLEDVSGLSRDVIEQLRNGLQRQSLGLLETESNTNGTSTDSYPTYIATIFIYCPPCTCLIDTAVDLCNNMPDPSLLRCLIRIDDRLPCSCLDQPIALETLQSIVTQIHQVEGQYIIEESYLLRSRAEHVDRDFIEDRIWTLEEEQSPPLPTTPEENLKRIFDTHCHSDNVAGVLFLGEHQSLATLMQVPSFPREPRMPKENELYVFWNSGGYPGTWRRSRIGTFSTKTQIIQNAQGNGAA